MAFKRVGEGGYQFKRNKLLQRKITASKLM